MSANGAAPGVRVAVDIGGTFTDLVIFDERDGSVTEAKASTTPRDFSQGVLDAIGVGGVSLESVGALVHGTTVVINAITQRRGVKTALVTTAGFRDALAIGRGNRPDMYNLRFHKPRPFVPRRHRFEVNERVAADGTVSAPLKLADLDPIVETCRTEGIAAVGVCFLHSFAHPAHERAAADYLRKALPDVPVTASHEITKEWREYERASTTVLNAYVQPILDRYLAKLETRLDDAGARGQRLAMLSNGGTATFDSARQQPIQLVESGPAAGIIGAALVGQQIGEPNVISLDIGGTTAKCSLIEEGRPKISSDYRLEWTPLSPGYPVRVPVVDIVEIGAGGGSIAWFDDGGALRVGPLSAGAEPGPACYGLGGTEPTVTDAMLIAGVIDANAFLGGRLKLDVELAETVYAPIAERLGCTVAQAASGVIRLVNEYTIDALKLVSVRRGHDPREFSLVAFGGGGPMHAAALIEELGVKRVIVPPFPGTFSAWGMLMTQPRLDLVRTRVLRLDDDAPREIAETFAALEREAAENLSAQGFARETIAHERALDLRYQGQEHTVRVPVASGKIDPAALAEAFHALHRRQYTFSLEQTGVEIVNFRAISLVQVDSPSGGQAFNPSAARSAPSFSRRAVDFDGIAHETRIVSRPSLAAGYQGDGPMIVEEACTTTVVLPGQRLEVDRFGNLLISAGTARA